MIIHPPPRNPYQMPKEPIYFIEEIDDETLVTLNMETSASMILDLFGQNNKFLIGFYDYKPHGVVRILVTARLPDWAKLCREYSNDEFVALIEHHFYSTRMREWVKLGMG